MKRFLITAIKIITLIYIFFGGVLYFYQQQLIYYPTQAISHPYATEVFNIEDEKINVIVINPDKEKAIAYFGGNADTVARRGKSFLKYYSDYTIYLMEYRGYGSSSGQPSEKAIYGDAVFIANNIRQRHNQFIVIGLSLGSGVATHVAKKIMLDCLVLVTPYDSVLAVAQYRYPIYPISLMLRDSFASINNVASLNVPTLALLAEFDQVIPQQHSKKLIDAFLPQYITVYSVPSANHDSIWNKNITHQKITQFLQTCY